MPTVDFKQPEAKDLPTDVKHEVLVQREAIPIVFVPGIMGSRLKAAKDESGLPSIRWDPLALNYMRKHYFGATAAQRKKLLIGPASFDENYLVPANASPVGDGFEGVIESYRDFLEDLKKHDWGDLGKVFVFPVHAFGYNWTASCTFNSRKLATRIQEIIDEAAAVVGVCKKVILLTHSMGGLVARAAVTQAGAASKVLGVVHGVQPATGGPAAYWRIKAGFEGSGVKGTITSMLLGDTGPLVAAVLANIPGGLELLPHGGYTASTGKAWLTVRNPDGSNRKLPAGDPYEEIYKVPAVVAPTDARGPSSNAYWGLVDPQFLDPDNQSVPNASAAKSREDLLDALAGSPSWREFTGRLDQAKAFHAALGTQVHELTFCAVGASLPTAETIDFTVEAFDPMRHDDNYIAQVREQERSTAMASAMAGGVYVPPPPPPPTTTAKVFHYPERGFRGALLSADGKKLVAVLQNPSGNGDGTVPKTSADAILQKGLPAPGNFETKVEHQPAYENGQVQKFTIKAINAMCLKHLG